MSERQPIPKRATPLPASGPTGPLGLGTFIESDCEIGGSSCARWNAWLWYRVEFVQAHPRAAEFQGLDDDSKTDAEDELIMKLELAGELPEPPDLPPCSVQTCRLFQAR